MNVNLRQRLSQFHSLFQRELMPLVEADLGEQRTKKLQQLLRIWEMIEIERFVPSWRVLVGRPPRERAALARALVAKTVLGLPTTAALVDRMAVDTTLRQLCGFDLRKKKMPGEHLFSRAFKEFSAQGLMQHAHEALIKAQLSDQLIGHIARDSTAIEAREKPPKRAKAATPAAQRKRGRPCKGDVRLAAEPTRIERQAAGMSLPAMLAELPRACDAGSKTNGQGFKATWIGYKGARQ